MNIRQQVIEDRVQSIISSTGMPKDKAFMRLISSLVLDKGVYDFNEQDDVDGGQDKQIDAFIIEQDGDEADIYLIQSKSTDSFSSNTIIQIRNGLNWIFNKPRKDILSLQNKAFQDKILEYRAVQNSIGPSNIRVRVIYATCGDTGKLSHECKQEIKTILDEYSNNTFQAFSFEPIGFNEILDLINTQEKKTRKIDAELKVKYDTNNPSLIKYYSQGLTGLVCTCPATEVARVVNNDSYGAIFDSNIRKFLGSSGAVNKEIFSACTTIDTSYQFWFLNNGITIVCDSFDAVTDPDRPHIKIKNMQIVNGCQTATTIALAQKAGELQPDTNVILRIYEIESHDFVNKIVLTTNNQNRITNRDLRANDQIQIDIERAFHIYGFYYERKPRQYAKEPVDPDLIFTNEHVAQAYLAIILKRPSDARRRKYKVWNELYSEIFGNRSVEPYITVALLSRLTSKWLSSSGVFQEKDLTKRKIAKGGALHVSRIAAFLWRNTDQWHKDNTPLEKQLRDLITNPHSVNKHIEQAFNLLHSLFTSEQKLTADIDTTFKSYYLDELITGLLHELKQKQTRAT